MPFVFKKPFMYAVAGYGVLSCVKGGVMRSIVVIIFFAKVEHLV